MNNFYHYCKFSELSGTVCSGVLLSFLYDLSKKSNGEFFCVTDKEICSTIKLGINKFRAAKKKICSIMTKDGPLVSCKIKGIPAKTFYKVNETALLEFLSKNENETELL